MSELQINDDQQRLSRRNLFRTAGMAAGAALAGSMLMTSSDADTMAGHMATDSPTMSDTANDLAILNYALTLEYLETDFYTRVVAANDANPYLDARQSMAAHKLREDEAAHVATITQVITSMGGTPVASPKFTFPREAFDSPIGFLLFAATLEVTGTSAYLGQAPRVRSKDVLKGAASIYGIEARHTGLIRFMLGEVFAPHDVETPLSMDEVLARVQPYIVT